jgi:hypothetical protein
VFTLAALVTLRTKMTAAEKWKRKDTTQYHYLLSCANQLKHREEDEKRSLSSPKVFSKSPDASLRGNAGSVFHKSEDSKRERIIPVVRDIIFLFGFGKKIC